MKNKNRKIVIDYISNLDDNTLSALVAESGRLLAKPPCKVCAYKINGTCKGASYTCLKEAESGVMDYISEDIKTIKKIKLFKKEKKNG